jgi:four helix bundle protein
MKENAQRSTSNAQRSNRGEGRQFDLEERLLDFGARIIAVVDALPRSRAGDHLGGQLVRSGTSPTLHHGEVEAAESPRDFVHKLRVCLKELRETRRCLRLIHRVELISPPDRLAELIDECDQLVRIFAVSVNTASAKLTTKAPAPPLDR